MKTPTLPLFQLFAYLCKKAWSPAAGDSQVGVVYLPAHK